MDDQEKQTAEALLSHLEQKRIESERRLQKLTIDNRLATEAEISEALDLADSLAALDTQIERLRVELREGQFGDQTTEHPPH